MVSFKIFSMDNFYMYPLIFNPGLMGLDRSISNEWNLDGCWRKVYAATIYHVFVIATATLNDEAYGNQGSEVVLLWQSSL